MEKFDNYVYYSICEISLEIYKKSSFTSYSTFCRNLNTAIVANSLTLKHKQSLINIIDKLETIYSLGPEVTGKYVSEYFGTNKFLIFEKPVVLTLELFKNSIH